MSCRLRVPVGRQAAVVLWLLVAAACKDQGPEEDFTTPDALTKASGDTQVLAQGATSEPFRVIVWTPDGKKCNGCAVHWNLASTAGPFESTDTETDVTGETSVTVSEAGPPGAFDLTASIPNGKSVTFTYSVQ